MPTRVKICGITNLADAVRCRDCGVDFIGLIFAESPRRVPIDEAASIARKMAGKVPLVGVFDAYDAGQVSRVTREVKLDYIQVYYHPENGPIKTPPLPLISSVWMDGNQFKLPPYPCQYLLLDFKKVGRVGGMSDFEWNMVKRRYNVFLAGGIDLHNISEILDSYRPFGIDAARGTEKRPGVKDWVKVEQLVKKVKSWSE